MNVSRKFGYRWLGAGLALAILLVQWRGDSPRMMLLPVLGGSLAMLKGKSVRAILFISDQKRWRYLWETYGRGLMGAAVFIYGFFLIPEGVPASRWGDISPVLPAVGVVLAAVAIAAPFGLRAVRKGEWFELRGVAPAVIQRLEEIQGEQEMPRVKPGERPSPT